MTPEMHNQLTRSRSHFGGVLMEAQGAMCYLGPQSPIEGEMWPVAAITTAFCSFMIDLLYYAQNDSRAG